MIKPRIRKQNLSSYEVFIDDPRITKKFFGIEVNDYFTTGKWSYFLNPPANRNFYYLKPETAILSELVDAAGKPIFIDYPTSPKKVVYLPDGTPILQNNVDGRSYGYFSPTSNPQKLLASVNVFDDVAVGFATLTLLGVATSKALKEVINDARQDQIDRWDGYYNIKYETQIEIIKDFSRKNTAPLIFKTVPSASISEVNQYYWENSTTQSLYTVTGSLTYTTEDANGISYYPGNVAPLQGGYGGSS